MTGRGAEYHGEVGQGEARPLARALFEHCLAQTTNTTPMSPGGRHQAALSGAVQVLIRIGGEEASAGNMTVHDVMTALGTAVASLVAVQEPAAQAYLLDRLNYGLEGGLALLTEANQSTPPPKEQQS